MKTIKFDFCSQIKPESSVARDKPLEHVTDQEMPRTCHLRYSLTSRAWAGLHYDQGAYRKVLADPATSTAYSTKPSYKPTGSMGQRL